MIMIVRVKIESQAGFIQSAPLTGSAVVAEKLVRFCLNRCRKVIARAFGDPTLRLQVSQIDHGLLAGYFRVDLSLTTTDQIPDPNPDAVRRALMASLGRWDVRVDVAIDGTLATHPAGNPDLPATGIGGGSAVANPRPYQPAPSSGGDPVAGQDKPPFPSSGTETPIDGGSAGKLPTRTGENAGRPEGEAQQGAHLFSSAQDEDGALAASPEAKSGDWKFAPNQASRAAGEDDRASADQNVDAEGTEPEALSANPMSQDSADPLSAADVQQLPLDDIEALPLGTSPVPGTIQPAPFRLVAPPAAETIEQYLVYIRDYALIIPRPYRGCYILARANDPRIRPGADISGPLASGTAAPRIRKLLPPTAIIDRRLED
ncbi:MAG: hypothetical protein OZ919_01915 [Xanthomonadaceae bacterium]|nr:hypothetical protein [Xanthomonadaceae bacterium]